jgi:hypothetical protein
VGPAQQQVQEHAQVEQVRARVDGFGPQLLGGHEGLHVGAIGPRTGGQQPQRLGDAEVQQLDRPLVADHHVGR